MPELAKRSKPMAPMQTLALDSPLACPAPARMVSDRDFGSAAVNLPAIHAGEPSNNSVNRPARSNAIKSS